MNSYILLQIITDYLEFSVVCLSVAIDCLFAQSVYEILSMSELKLTGLKVIYRW
ncbi:MAG: hypothetical protein ACK521_07655 [bacterium]